MPTVVGGDAPVKATTIRSKAIEEDDGAPRITKQGLKKICKEQDLYSTPELNDILYLHYKGFCKIENLEEYVGLKCLWLEGNGLDTIENLDALVNLKCLYLQKNFIKVLENMDTLCVLDTINVSNNSIASLSGLAPLVKLSTLTCAHNRLKTADDLAGLLSCPSIRILDFSNNMLEDPNIVQIFEQMPALRVLSLMSNPVVRAIPDYRKTMIYKCKELTYLDDRPVADRERACSVAFFEGFGLQPPGRDAERDCRQHWLQAERDKQAAAVNNLLALRGMAPLGTSNKPVPDPITGPRAPSELFDDDEASGGPAYGGSLESRQGLGPGFGGASPSQSAHGPSTSFVTELSDSDGSGGSESEQDDREAFAPTGRRLLVEEIPEKPVPAAQPAICAMPNTRGHPGIVLIDDQVPDLEIAPDDIPEEISAPKHKPGQWHSASTNISSTASTGQTKAKTSSRMLIEEVVSETVAVSATPPAAVMATKVARPMIEMIGDDLD